MLHDTELRRLAQGAPSQLMEATVLHPPLDPNGMLRVEIDNRPGKAEACPYQAMPGVSPAKGDAALVVESDGGHFWAVAWWKQTPVPPAPAEPFSASLYDEELAEVTTPTPLTSSLNGIQFGGPSVELVLPVPAFVEVMAEADAKLNAGPPDTNYYASGSIYVNGSSRIGMSRVGGYFGSQAYSSQIITTEQGSYKVNSVDPTIVNKNPITNLGAAVWNSGRWFGTRLPAGTYQIDMRYALSAPSPNIAQPASFRNRKLWVRAEEIR